MKKRVSKKVLRKDCDGLWDCSIWYGKVPWRLYKRATIIRIKCSRRYLNEGKSDDKWNPYFK
jgi:hypothetical protein